MSLPIFEAASILTDRVHTEALPDDKSRPAPVYTYDWDDDEGRAQYNAFRYWKPSDEASAQKNVIHEVSDVEVGDLVLVVNNTKYRGEWSSRPIREEETVADVARRRYGAWHVVTAVKAKRITIASLSIPRANWCDEVDAYKVSDYTETVAPYADARRIIKTGLTLDEFKARVTEHPDYSRHVAIFAAAAKKREEIEEQERREAAAKRAAAAPFETAAKRASEALGVDGVVEASGYGEKRIALDTRYLGGDDKRRLVTLALAGRLALGEITQEQHDEAVRIVLREGKHSL